MPHKLYGVLSCETLGCLSPLNVIVFEESLGQEAGVFGVIVLLKGMTIGKLKQLKGSFLFV